jgi:hypothetical protein
MIFSTKHYKVNATSANYAFDVFVSKIKLPLKDRIKVKVAQLSRYSTQVVGFDDRVNLTR